MALQNGVLVHGRTSWACAVRDTDGTLHVSSGRSRTSPRRRGLACRCCAAPSRSQRRSRCYRWCGARFLEPAFHSSGRLCSGRSPRRRSPLALRRSSLPAGARELVAVGVAFVPALLASRTRPRRIPRCRAHLDRYVRERRHSGAGAPTVWIAAHCADGRLVPRRERRRIQSTNGDSRGRACARPRGRRGRLGRALLLGRSEPREPGRSSACPTRIRAPAAVLRRAVERSSRSRTSPATPASPSSSRLPDPAFPSSAAALTRPWA